MIKPSDDLIYQGVTHRFVEPIYRYHLARCGSQREAESLTRQTFQTLFRSTSSSRLEGMDNSQLSELVFRIAIHRQKAMRRGQTADALAEGDPNEEQQALYRRARFTALAEHWANLPPFQADTLALAVFAGLDEVEIGRVMRRSPSIIRAILVGQAEAIQPLNELAAEVRPPTEWMAGLADDLAHPTAQVRLPVLSFPLAGADQWKKFAAISLAGILLGYSLWATLLAPSRAVGEAIVATSAAPAALAASPTPTPAPPSLTSSDPAGSAAVAGYLVPPDPAVCQAWRTALSDLVKAPYPLALTDNAPIDDPSTSGPEGTGYGCFVDLTSDGPLFRVNLASIQSYVNNQGFKQIGSVSAPCATPPGASSLYNYSQGCNPERVTSWASTQSSISQKVIVELVSSWPDRFGRRFGLPGVNPTPSAGATAVPQAATPPYAYDPCLRNFNEESCQPTHTAYQPRPFTLRVGIATDSIRHTIDHFLYQWAANQSGAMAQVTSQLLASQPSLASLDQRVGILRRPDLTVSFTWQVISNTGLQISVSTTADEPSALALPDKVSGPFTVVFTQVSGKWLVSSVSPGVN